MSWFRWLSFGLSVAGAIPTLIEMFKHAEDLSTSELQAVIEVALQGLETAAGVKVPRDIVVAVIDTVLACLRKRSGN